MITVNVFVRVKPGHREELVEVGHTLFDALAKEPTFMMRGSMPQSINPVEESVRQDGWVCGSDADGVRLAATLRAPSPP